MNLFDLRQKLRSHKGKLSNSSGIAIYPSEPIRIVRREAHYAEVEPQYIDGNYYVGVYDLSDKDQTHVEVKADGYWITRLSPKEFHSLYKVLPTNYKGEKNGHTQGI
jgi:hypothetical protein